MKRYLTLLAALFSVCVSFAATKTFESNVGQFVGLNVNDDVRVVYHCNPDSTGWIHYECEPELADALMIRVGGGSLKISVTTQFAEREAEMPVVHVYSDYLTSVISSSSREVEIVSPAPCPEFKASLIGNGTLRVSGLKCTSVGASLKTGNGLIVLEGECSKARLSMVGTGTIQADQLDAKVVNCHIMGAGSIGCSPADTLKVRGIGSTKIYYSGDPVVDKKGGGKLIKLQSSDDSEPEEESGEEADKEEEGD